MIPESVEKMAGRNAERVADLVQPRCHDRGRARLVAANLLLGYFQQLGKLRAADRQLRSSLADAPADMGVHIPGE